MSTKKDGLTGKEDHKDKEPQQLPIIIADWLDQGLVSWGDDRARSSSPDPTIREHVFNALNRWLQNQQQKHQQESLLNQATTEQLVLDLVDLFLDHDKKRIPRQDQISLFFAVAGIDLSQLLDPSKYGGQAPLVREQNGEIRFRTAVGATARIIHTILINQIRQQRPSALISDEEMEIPRSDDAPRDTVTTIRFKTKVNGLVAEVVFWNKSETRTNIQGMPLILNIRLLIPPDMIGRLTPLSHDDMLRYTHYQDEPQFRGDAGTSRNPSGATAGRSQESPDQDDFDPMKIGPIILRELGSPTLSENQLDYAIFGFTIGLPFTRQQLQTRYRQLIKMYHPDKNPDLDVRVIKRINDANERMGKKTSG